MNLIYRVIWNAQQHCWQAVAETAKGKTKSSKIQSTLAKVGGFITLTTLLTSTAFALPTSGSVSTGTATIGSSGSTLTVTQTTAKATINWASFSTSSTETVNFVQPSTSSLTLNRVTGATSSTLAGTLNANGQVFIINPNGVLINSGAHVNVGGLVASTLNLSDANFNAGTYNLANTANTKTVENKGIITVPTGGKVALLAPVVKSSGTITAPQGSILLASAGDVTITLPGSSPIGYTINTGKASALVNTSGTIQADGGSVVLTAQGVDALSTAVINTAGTIRAQTVSSKLGSIQLLGDTTVGVVNVGGTLDASAPTSGNGGVIKTYGAEVDVLPGTTVTTKRVSTALAPTTSYWELKANNIDVETGATIDGGTLSNALNNGNVTLNAIGTDPTQHNVAINETVSWNANTALALKSVNSINFNSDLNLSAASAKLTLNFGSSYDYNINNGSKINITGATPTLIINGITYTVINDIGTEGDASTTTLQGMANNLSGNYAVGSDLDASATSGWNGGLGFQPVGSITFDPVTFTVTDNSFTGKFHGLGHTIDSLYINDPSSGSLKAIGLFGVASNSTLRDIGLTNANITGNNVVGALVGGFASGNIKNSYSTGTVSGVDVVGGLVGSGGTDANINLSHSDAVVTGYVDVGGLVGIFQGNAITNSYATGDVTGLHDGLSPSYDYIAPYNEGDYIGGLIGTSSAILTNNSYATGNVSGNYRVGGLIGQFQQTQAHVISNSYATGNVIGEVNSVGSFGGEVGGLIGVVDAYAGTPSSSTLLLTQDYASGNVTGLYDAGGLVGSNTNHGTLNISLSHASGDVIATSPSVHGPNAGGLVATFNGGSIDQSYATGSVTASDFVGGLVGYNSAAISNSYATGAVTVSTGTIDQYHIGGGLIGSNLGSVSNSYSSGSVTGVSGAYLGGLIGSNVDPLTVTNSYWNTTTSGLSISDGGVGKTDTEMKQIATFFGWDIADISDPLSTSLWVIDEGSSAPTLRNNP